MMGKFASCDLVVTIELSSCRYDASPVVPVPARALSAFNRSDIPYESSGPSSSSRATVPPAAGLAPLPVVPESAHSGLGLICIMGPDGRHIGYLGKPPGRPTGYEACHLMSSAVRVFPWTADKNLSLLASVPPPPTSLSLRNTWIHVGIRWSTKEDR